MCEFYRSRASVVDITPPRNTCDALSSASKDPAIPALCIELVGSRFLRCMVRIIVATLVREAMRPTADRREDVLLHCVQNENRMLAACAINGKGLSLSGVGYALERATEHGKAGAVGNPAAPKGAGKRRKKDRNAAPTPDEVTEQQLSQRQRRHAGQTSDIA